MGQVSPCKQGPGKGRRAVMRVCCPITSPWVITSFHNYP